MKHHPKRLNISSIGILREQLYYLRYTSMAQKFFKFEKYKLDVKSTCMPM
jgi:hypothetical protein